MHVATSIEKYNRWKVSLSCEKRLCTMNTSKTRAKRGLPVVWGPKEIESAELPVLRANQTGSPQCRSAAPKCMKSGTGGSDICRRSSAMWPLHTYSAQTCCPSTYLYVLTDIESHFHKTRGHATEWAKISLRTMETAKRRKDSSSW